MHVYSADQNILGNHLFDFTQKHRKLHLPQIGHKTVTQH